MREEVEERLIKEIEALKKQLNKLEGKSEEGIPTYSFSNIKLDELKSLLNVKKFFNSNAFNQWFNSKMVIPPDDSVFLEILLSKYGNFLKAYKEETLKANFIIPIINRVDFLSLELETSSFYEEIITYKTDKFIFTGTTDFMVSKGLEYSEKPYFFIQEFKKGIKGSDPEPQLLAELISAIELNNEISMRGAYIIGAIWNFVILEKLGKDKYQYFVSQNFDSTKIGDLKAIYKNLVFVKNEIMKKVQSEDLSIV